MKGIKFTCPSCQDQVFIDSIVRADTDRIYLMGNCVTCEERFRFDIEGVIKQLFPPKTQGHLPN